MRDYSINDVIKVKNLINDASYVLIGGGSGLSASGGLLYNDFGTFNQLFPGYYERYGLSFIYQAAFFDFPTEEEYLAYWVRHIYKIRLYFTIGEVYFKIKKLIEGKKSFVLTTNCDGQFYRAGFDQANLFSPQGDYAYFQCMRPCTDMLFDNKAWVEKVYSNLKEDSFAISKDEVFRCPKCGGRVEPNLRKDYRFVEKFWMQKSDAYHKFIEEAVRGQLVLLEMGVGFNTPGIIRYPFEKLTAMYQNAHLLRINRGDHKTHVEGAQIRTLSFDTDITAFINELKKKRLF